MHHSQGRISKGFWVFPCGPWYLFHCGFHLQGAGGLPNVDPEFCRVLLECGPSMGLVSQG